MEDRGLTREEKGAASHSIDNLRMRCDQIRKSIIDLDASLPRQPERAGAAGKEWLQHADAIARQLRSLGEDTAPLLDHWVFHPVDPGPPTQPMRLPELLRTKMREEQEQRDGKLRERSEVKRELSEIQERQAKTSDALEKILTALNENPAIDVLAAKRQKVVETIAANAAARKKDNFDGLALLRLMTKNDQSRVKTEEDLEM